MKCITNINSKIKFKKIIKIDGTDENSDINKNLSCDDN